MSSEVENSNTQVVRWRGWAGVVFLLPTFYLLIFTLPQPFGMGLHFANDFYGNRIWWTQLSSYQLLHGYVPIWNHTENLGGYHLGFKGPGFLYLPNLWIYFVGFIGGAGNYIAQYVSISLHMGVALLGIFAILLRFGQVTPAAAALGSSLYLLNNRFNDSVQYANTVEAATWVPWMLFFGLCLVRSDRVENPWRDPQRWQHIIGFASCTALSWLAGYGHLTAIGIMLVALVCVLASRNILALCQVAIGGALGCVLGGPMMYVSAMKAVGTPERSGGSIAWADAYPLHYSLRTILSKPFSMDVSSSPFFMPVFLLLLTAGMLVAWRKSRWQISFAMLVAMLMIADLSRGRAGFLFPIFYEHVPFYGSFRIQGRNSWMLFIPLGWFVASGVDALAPYRKRLWLGIPLLIVFSGLLYYGFQNQPFDGSSYAPFTQKWISYDGAKIAYGFLTLGAGLVVLLYLFAAGFLSRAASLGLLTILFVAAYAVHATFTGNGMVKWAKISAMESYPGGTLQAFRSRDFGPERMLWSTGTISQEDRGNRGYEMAVPDVTALFPASRFLVLADDSPDHARLELKSMGAHHVKFVIDMPVPGNVVFFNAFAKAWHGNVDISRGPGLLDTFMSFSLPAGKTEVKLWFFNFVLMMLCSLTILGLTACVIASLRFASRPYLGGVAFLFGLVWLSAFWYGATNHRTYPSESLFGKDGGALDQQGLVPVMPEARFLETNEL